MVDKKNISQVDSVEESESLLKTEWIKIVLEPSVTLSQLMDLKNKLSQCLGHRVQLNGAQIERIDTAALQLLLAFINSAEVTVGWVEPAAELCRSARLLGLSSLMSLPLEEPSTLNASY